MMSIFSVAAASHFSANSDNRQISVKEKLAQAIQNNDVEAVQSSLAEVDGSAPEITTITKNALISDTVSLEIKEKLLEASAHFINIDDAIFNGESAREYAIRREDTALLQVLTKYLAGPNIENTTTADEKVSLVEKLTPQTLAGITAGAAGGAVAVFIDKGMVETISGKWSFRESMRDSVKQLIPGQQRNIAKAYLAVGGACITTYAVANTVEAAAAHYEIDPMLPKLLVTTAVNATVSIARDRTLAHLLIPGKSSAGSLSRASIAFFLLRDGLTMFGVFGPQTKLRQYFQNNWSLSAQHATQLTQVVAPAIMQIGASIPNILGFDYCKNPNDSLTNRLQTIKATYLRTLLARSGRISVAYGLVANFNTYLRSEFSSSKKG